MFYYQKIFSNNHVLYYNHRGKMLAVGLYCEFVCDFQVLFELYFSNSKTKSRVCHGFFFFIDFLSQTFTVHRTAGERGRGNFFNSYLPLLPASQTLQPGDYFRELTSAHSWQPDSDRGTLVYGRKSQTIKLRAFAQALFT